MLSASDDFEIDKITAITNGIYASGEILQHRSRSRFVTRTNQPDINEFEFYWLINLMSHIANLIIMVLMKRTCKKLDANYGKNC